MRQKPMVPNIHSERAEDVTPQHRKHDPGPAEGPGQARENRGKMHENDRGGISPFDAPRVARCRRMRVIGTARFKIVVHHCGIIKVNGTLVGVD